MKDDLKDPTSEENQGTLPKPISFWENMRAKSLVVFLMFFVSFMLTFPNLYGVLAIPQFPLGLLFWYDNWNNLSNVPNKSLPDFYFLGWTIYLTLSGVIITTQHKMIVRILFLFLTLLLLINIYGCHLQLSHWQGPG